MKKTIALAVTLCMSICIGIKFNVVSMNSPEDLANQALIKAWQQTISEINTYEARLTNSTQNDEGIVEVILHALREKKQELEKNPHVQTFMSLMNQTPIREAIPALNCKAYLRPKFIAFIYANADLYFYSDEIGENVAWSPAGTNRLAITKNPGTNIVNWDWDLPVLTLLHNNEKPFSVAWSTDATKLATGSISGVQIWDTTTGILLRAIQYNNGIHSVTWSPDATKLLTGSHGGAAIWNATTGNLMFTIQDNNEDNAYVVYSVAWSPDSTKLAIAASSTLNIWEKSGRLLNTFQNNVPIYSVAWSPDSTKLATGSAQRAEIWDAVTYRLILTLPHNIEDVKSVAWSPDGTKLATHGTSARIWYTNTGALLYTLHTAKDDATMHSTGINSLSWHPNGTALAIGTEWQVQIWDVAQLEYITRFLDSLNIDQCDLLRAIDMAMQQMGRIQSTEEQWQTFMTFPFGAQLALNQYIKAPAQVSYAEREKAFEQRQRASTTTAEPEKKRKQTSSSTTTIAQPIEGQSEEHQGKFHTQEPAEPLQEQNNDDDDDDESLSSHGKEKDTGPRKIRRKK